ncbi:MAG: DUF6766 family protein [Candidatus Andersenbacteria bacterium]
MPFSLTKKYSYLWVTLAFFCFSVAGHWLFAWYAYVDEQNNFNHLVRAEEYFVQVSRDTFENWQSEFLQLIWQVGGLALLLYVGSPQSKEGDERKEEKVDRILEMVDPKAKRFIATVDRKYPRQ